MTIKYLQIPVKDSYIVVEIEPVRDIHIAPGLDMLGVDRSTVSAAENEIEVLGAPESAQRAIESVIAVATVAFDRIEESVGLIANGFASCIKQTGVDSATIEFGITLNAEAGVIVKTGGDASFKVSLTWSRQAEANTR